MLKLFTDTYYISFIILFSLAFYQGSFAADQGEDTEYILCRSCGEDISTINYAFNLQSPHSKSVKNVTHFERRDIYLQVLENPLGVRFKLMTLSKSTCLEHGSWHTEDSWFPGFAWKVCLCPRCNKHLGWWFEPTQPAKREENGPEEKFCGLNVDSLISNKVADSLIVSVKI